MDPQTLLAKFPDVTQHVPGNVRALAGVQEQVTMVQRIINLFLVSLLGAILRNFMRKTRLFYLALTDDSLVALTLANEEPERVESFRLSGISGVAVQRGNGLHELAFDYEGSRREFKVFHGFVTTASGSYFSEPEVGKALMAMTDDMLRTLETTAATAKPQLAASAS